MIGQVLQNESRSSTIMPSNTASMNQQQTNG
jgi:hypothetical protein